MQQPSIDEIFPNVYILNNKEHKFLATKNLTPRTTFYGEPTFIINEIEYRSWNPTRSKLAAAILKGIRCLPIKLGSRVLYLGAASGTTVSHVSDIIEEKGHICGLDISPRSLRDLLDKVSRYRGNISPILGDARKPDTYYMLVPQVDIIFSDVAQADQAAIVIKNATLFLQKGGWVMLSIKSRSIDVKGKPQEIYKEQVDILKNNGFKVHELVELSPYEKDHAMAIAEYV